ncbi:hypothetical protein BDV26DRAFT_274382 [Aspergillus bertholletiae]|uniref:Uncharacterized protein n=1 Tax=Aspergillus bertholletiae TaxID=1226010 RepID=A0A5N7AU39_9EURO|nr:hypothetical protein BDV26DRAFT_274382 [Aspergillus bertholletiae]
MARPCKNCGAPRADDVPDEIELCEQCTAGSLPAASVGSQTGSPTRPNTPASATQSDGSEGNTNHAGDEKEAADVDEPILIPNPESVPGDSRSSQVETAPDAVGLMPPTQSGNAVRGSNRRKRKASALGVEEPALDARPDKSAGGTSLEDIPNVGQGQDLSSHQQTTSAAAVNPAKKPKLRPACDVCRRSKVRCTHRLVEYSEEGVLHLKSERPIQPKPSDQSVSGDPGEEASSTRAGPSPESQSTDLQPPKIPPRARGRPRKARSAEPAETQAVVNEGAIVEEPESSPRRPRRGRKPAAQRIATSAEENMSIASNIALNNYRVKAFQDAVRDCEVKWQAVSDTLEEAMDSFRAARQKIDCWLEMWTRGEV